MKNSISFDTLCRCINTRIIMHRPSSFPVHLHGRLHRLPLSPSLSLSLPPFLHSVDRARFSFGERENIEYNMGRGARIIYTRRLGFFQKNSHKESDLIRFRRRIFIRGGRSVHARGWPSEKTRKKDRGEGGKKDMHTRMEKQKETCICSGSRIIRALLPAQ